MTLGHPLVFNDTVAVAVVDADTGVSVVLIVTQAEDGCSDFTFNK